jgi:hypothetical protein
MPTLPACWLVPPYLVDASADGLVDYIRHVCADAAIVYQRANAIYTPRRPGSFSTFRGSSASRMT